MIDTANIYKKEIFKRLPHTFPDANAIVTQEDIGYLYPQSFTIDWDAKEVLILYIPFPKTGQTTYSQKRWVVVWNLDTNAYKGCFQAGSANGEAIVIKYEGTSRYVFVKTDVKTLGKFLVNPATSYSYTVALGTPVSFPSLGADWQFSYRNGKWIILQDAPALGGTKRLNHYAVYDESLTSLIGTITTDVADGGIFNPPVATDNKYLPKRQGTALGDGFIIFSMGGYGNKTTSVDPYSYQGIKVIDMKGDLVSEGILDHKKMITILEQNGCICSHVENEGAHVAPNGDVYSILVHTSPTWAGSTSQGILIFKEFSSSSTAIDFTSAATSYPSLNIDRLSNGVFPLTSGKMYNPLNGNLLDSLPKIIDFMFMTQVPSFTFYSTSVSVADCLGVEIPDYILVTLINCNNNSVRCVYNADPYRTFNIYKDTNGVWKQNEQTM